MPFKPDHLRNKGKALVLSLCLLSSCAPAVSRLPAIPPLSDTPQGNPARDAQSLLLREAYRAFVQERYPVSVLFLQRYIEDASDSLRLVEARWWLGRAYEHLGDYRAAMAQYRLITTEPLLGQVHKAEYEGEALRRLEELRQLHADPHKGRSRQMALRLDVSALPPIPQLADWLQAMAKEGMTAIVIEPAMLTNAGHSRHELKTIQNLVAIAHGIGLPLWVVLDLHRGDGTKLRPEWTATMIAGHRPGGESAPRPDIANDGYQSYLERLVRALSRTRCDGIVLTARSMTGFANEFSSDSLREFALSFDLNLTPDELFELKQSSNGLIWERSATYWRWVGWKALRYATLVTRLRDTLRKIHPTAMLLIEIHQSTLTAPLQGLEQYGEDLAELISRTGGSVVLQHEGGKSKALLEQIGRQQVPTTDRIWLGASVNSATSPPSISTLKEEILNIDNSGRWNLLIQAEPVKAVP